MSVTTAPPRELTFTNVLGVYNALWDVGGVLAVAQEKEGASTAWLLEYRSGLRGFLARVHAVDRHYILLQEYQTAAAAMGATLNPNEWAVQCEYHAGVIFFGVDSSVECLTYALNAIGWMKESSGFCDIADQKSLRKISPKNILGGGSTDKHNPKPGYSKHFPRTVAVWTSHEAFLARVVELHDVSKHRSAIAQGGKEGELQIREAPKEPTNHSSSADTTVQSLCAEYQAFIDTAMVAALEDVAAMSGLEVTSRSRPAV